MPKMTFFALAASGALAGAAVTYLAMGRQVSANALRGAASMLDRTQHAAAKLRDDVSTAWANARMPKTVDAAFELHRQDVLRRLEKEQRQLHDDLYRLRHAEDQFEFEAVLAGRNTPPNVAAAPGNGETDAPIQTP